MAEKTPPNFPAVGEEARFDAILQRGNSLRRGRTAKRAAVFGSLGMMALAIAIFGFVDTSTPSQASQVFADSAEVDTPTVPTSALGQSGQLKLSIEQAAGGAGATINVSDSAAAVAVAGEPPAQQCVTVTVRAAGSGATGVVLAEGFTCSGGSGVTAVTEVPLIAAVDGVQVGCAATAIRTDATPDLSEPLNSTFEVSLPAGMSSGNYQITAEAVSGLGDGCAGSAEGSSESEHSARAAGSFAL